MRLAMYLLLMFLAPAASAQVKVFISTDMEGIAGAVTDAQLGPEGFEYAAFRQFMTDETLAAIRGARAAGATEILVADSHGNGQNLLLDKLPKDVTVVRSWPRPLGMMEGVDDSFAAAVFIGYHTAASNLAGVRAHTFSSANLFDVKLNGRSVSEGAFNAAIAAHFGVPVVAISGDDAVIAEAKDYAPGAEGAVVKWAKSFHSARTLTPHAAQELIEAAVQRGVAGRGRIKTPGLRGAVTVEVSFKHYRQAELLAYLPGFERIDSRTVRFKAKDMLEAARIMQFVNNYQPGLSP